MSTVVVRNPEERRLNQRAMRLSLAVGFAMLAGKAAAYVLTGSSAIMSDALESVIHVLAVAFAAFSLSLSAKPADSRFPYGYERIAFFSAGFEGALIILAAASIIWTAVARWLHGLQLERLGTGVLLVLAASVVNGALGARMSVLCAGGRPIARRKEHRPCRTGSSAHDSSPSPRLPGSPWPAGAAARAGISTRSR